MEINDIETSILELQKRFLEIRKMEYVKSVRAGNTGVGATFESLLLKQEDSLEIPDFKGIEIKTKRSYSKAKITLFNMVPTGSTYYEVKRLRDTYGYRDNRDSNLKKLHTEVGTKEMVKVGIYYYFKLRVDRKKECVILGIYDWNKKLIEESTYWDFDVLKEKLYRKLRILAVVKAWPNRIGRVEYFKYYKMNIYLLKDFEAFIKAMEQDMIKINLKIGNYYGKEKYSMVNSHGVSISISEENLDQLFDLYR